MAEIIVLTEESRKVLRTMLFDRINELESNDDDRHETELATLHRIYADTVKKR